MKIIRCIDAAGRLRLATPSGDDTAEALDGDLLSGQLQRTGESIRVDHVLPPLDPVNILCIGKNYADHAREFGNDDLPERPILFMKPTSAVTGPGEPIRIPACEMRGPECDYEAELVAVIGKHASGPARDLTAAQALDHVLGYTLANDVSARRWQKHGGGEQWVRGKSFDTFCPLGPCLVTARPIGGDDQHTIADPQDLPLKSTLNGQTMQDGHTRDMIFPVAELVAFLSQDTTLLPGTIILTGTPDGVGAARKPPVFLQPGDHMSVSSSPIGELESTVVAG